MQSIEAQAAIQVRMIEHACQNKDVQRDLEALTQWAVKELELAAEEIHWVRAAAARAIMLIQEYQYYSTHAQSGLTPPKYIPATARLLVVPFKGERHFLHNDEYADLCLHHTALVGSLPGPGNLAILYECQQPILCHEDQQCINMVGETFRGGPLTPIQLTGNEGYAPCCGCGLPVAGPSLKESFEHPPLPVPDDIAEMLYSCEQSPFQPSSCPKQQHRKQRQK